MSSAYTVPLFLRGEVITDDLVSFGTRSGGAQFAGAGYGPPCAPAASAEPDGDGRPQRAGLRRDPRRARGIGQRARLRPQHAPAGSLRGCAAGEPAAAGDAQEQLPDPATAVLPRQRRSRSPTARSGSITSTAGSPQQLGRRTGVAGTRIRLAGVAHPGGQRRPRLGGDDPALGDHPLRHDHQGAVQRSADGGRDRAHARRRRARPPDHQDISRSDIGRAATSPSRSRCTDRSTSKRSSPGAVWRRSSTSPATSSRDWR